MIVFIVNWNKYYKNVLGFSSTLITVAYWWRHDYYLNFSTITAKWTISYYNRMFFFVNTTKIKWMCFSMKLSFFFNNIWYSTLLWVYRGVKLSWSYQSKVNLYIKMNYQFCKSTKTWQQAERWLYKSTCPWSY